ncbi:MAG: ABC transporter permease subunit [Spongiibacteraceae bacterium]
MPVMKNTHSSSSTVTISREKISEQRLSGWRKVKDSAANLTITAGGMAVLFSILLIFFYLLYEILPLFAPAQVELQSEYSLASPQSARTLYMAMEEQAEIATQLDDSGLLQFFKATDGQPVSEFQLPVSTRINSFALNSEQEPLLALATGGEVLLIKPDYKTSYSDAKRLITPVVNYPYGEQPLKFKGKSISSLAVRDSNEQLVLVVNIDGILNGRRFVKEENFLTGEKVITEEELALPIVDIPADWLLIDPDQRWLYVASKQGDYRVINLANEELIDAGRLNESGKLTDFRFLLGGISLIAASDTGEVSQWFMVRESNKPARLQYIRSFQQGDVAIKSIAVEHRRKGFYALDANDRMTIYYTTSERELLTQPMVAEEQADTSSSIVHFSIAPRADALLLKNNKGSFSYWTVANEHPEVSFSALWSKVWYESYPEPDYIWQSSASSNDFEPKYSFAPLAFGTLKAAFYAMVIAAPLAICGAIYTAYFMAPAVRRKIKPLIELMEALPTVILGFLAGLWLAPFIERNLPGVFSIFVLIPVGVLLFGYLWSRLPENVRLRVPDGWHAVFLMPVIVLIAWSALSFSGVLELWFFDGDMRAWLTHDMGIAFDQRNAMVVGIAMGFAVIPTIFSIAEDAIFSVPKSLTYGSLAVGATPWQTLVGVVIPTASPGIFSALMIGMGRAVGETMIVLMATGNTPIMDANIFEGMRTLAANIAVEIGETEVDSSHFRVLFLAAFVLFLFTFVVNTAAEIVRQRLRKKYGSL